MLTVCGFVGRRDLRPKPGSVGVGAGSWHVCWWVRCALGARLSCHRHRWLVPRLCRRFGRPSPAAPTSTVTDTDLVLTGVDDTEDVARAVIQVMYGGDYGLSLRRMQDLALQELVPPRPEGLGASSGLGGLTTGDFDGDGYSDLAIGIRALEVAGVRGAGGVLLLRGSTHGLVEQAWQLITQASPGVPDRPEKGDGFGSSLAAANLGRGPEDDLVIGVSLEDLRGGVTEGGQVHVLYGSTLGVDLATSEIWRQSSRGIDGRARDHDRWSTTLATGDFDGSSYADLAIGSTGPGTVHVLYGSTRGLTYTGSQHWSADMPTCRSWRPEATSTVSRMRWLPATSTPTATRIWPSPRVWGRGSIPRDRWQFSTVRVGG